MDLMWGRGVALIVVLGSLAGCGTNSTAIHGDWVYSALDGETRMSFKDDGTYTTSSMLKGAKLVQSGTFRLTGTWLHIIPEKVKTDNEKLQAIYDREHLVRQVMRAKWEGNDKLRLSMSGTKVTLLLTRAAAVASK